MSVLKQHRFSGLRATPQQNLRTGLRRPANGGVLPPIARLPLIPAYSRDRAHPVDGRSLMQ